MKMIDSQQLLKEYVLSRSESAFRELVSRYVDLVHSTAFRLVDSDAHRAEDVTQTVFMDLARMAPCLSKEIMLGGWLHRHTCFVAANTMRGERRRQSREKQAVEMNAMQDNSRDTFGHVAPILDEAINELGEADRTAILLRFFEQQDFRSVGQALGSNEDAARMRVTRALDKLQGLLERRGVTAGAATLSVLLAANAVQAAPIGLAITISTAATVGNLGLAASAGSGATSGFIGMLAKISPKLFLAGSGTIAGMIVFLLIHFQEQAGQNTPDNAATPNAEQKPTAATTANQDASADNTEREPDPLQLLQAVARARQQITSGSMDILLSVERTRNGVPETNDIRMEVQFDAPKLRFEQFQQEFSYMYAEVKTEQAEIVKRADGMDRKSAIKAGLLTTSESHHTTAYDGTALIDYLENDRKAFQVTIHDPAKDVMVRMFDPRCLGLSTFLGLRHTIENDLACNEAKSIQILGKESVEEAPAWHVQVKSKNDVKHDFWISVAQPTQVLKYAQDSDFAISKYDSSFPRDPFPVEVTIMSFQNGVLRYRQKYIRSNSKLNTWIDPVSFTMAGLEIPAGTEVVDMRISRSIGYWTGAGLSENKPAKQETEPLTPPHMDEMLYLLDYNAASPEALDAATWILQNTPDGPEVDKACEAIIKEHSLNLNLVPLIKDLERVRHRRSKVLLETILKNNPSKEVRGAACFTLAKLLKDEAKHGQNKQATIQAEKQFERVIREFGQLKERGFTFEELSKPELSELRHLIPGKPAPDIEGKDLNDQPMKLSDYRGKVVVLVFWTGEYSDVREHPALTRLSKVELFFLTDPRICWGFEG